MVMKSGQSFHVENFGCRATQADGAAIERQFRERGLVRAVTSAEAEVVVLNTCTVTAAADQDARAAIRRIHSKNPNTKIVVTGCYAQRAPEEVAALPGVAQVIGNSHKHQLADLALSGHLALPSWLQEETRSSNVTSQAISSFVPLSALATGNEKLRIERSIFVSDIFAHTELLAAPVFERGGEAHQSSRTRPNLKVQDGCGNRCSFCVIPSVRGNSRSLHQDRILQEVNTLIHAGYREVVISGINLGRWGHDLEDDFSQRPKTNGQRLENLIHSILNETSLEKLRISSVEPMDWSDELINLMASSPRIAKHVHVPLQSGSDTVLRRMHRKYRPWHYREKIEKIHAAMPGAAIGADVMVGFPGETEAEFAETKRMIEDLPFTYLHVFTYSARPGTPAATMPSQVPVHIARERNRILRELAEQKKLSFMRGFVGQTIQTITLNACSEVSTECLTDNYLKLRLAGQHPSNLWVSAKVEKVEEGMLIGALIH
jgi:threonylcarbamoyladenosine tRNA methylthiotransferase MtaB